MDEFAYRRGVLHCEDVNLEELAERHDTPIYVYSRGTALRHLAGIAEAFAPLDPLLCFAVKSCGNVHLLHELGRAGAGADVVSGGELYRSLMAGIPARRTVFAGVGKTDDELAMAVDSGVRRINVESEQELEALSAIAAARRRRASVAIRVNPDVPGYRTHMKTTTGVRGSKFGIDIDRVETLFGQADTLPGVALDGLHVHLGSPIYDAHPYRRALTRLVDLADKLEAAGHPIRSINTGGGFAAAYETEGALRWTDYADAIVPVLRPFADRGGEVIIEPGRSIIANAGVLLTRVVRVKTAGDRQVAVVDAGMNNLVRSAMYDSFHFLWPVRPDGPVPTRRAEEQDVEGLSRYDVAGPICESSDYLARARPLPRLAAGDLLCVYTAGAYGMSMSSQYNALPRASEVMVDGASDILIRRRESYSDLVAAELAARPLGD